MKVIADCIEKLNATTDQKLITDHIAEALGVLQTDNTEGDAFNMLGSAIVDAVADDEAHSAALFEVCLSWRSSESCHSPLPGRRRGFVASASR
jgi:hypothetical protein